MSLYSIIYQSRALIPDDPALHDDILKTCYHRNLAHDLTGFLHREDDWFLQYIEGPRDAVQAALDRITADARHTDVAVLQRQAIDMRRFPDWQMGFVHDTQFALSALIDTQGGRLNLHTEDPFDLVVFLANNAEMLRQKAAA